MVTQLLTLLDGASNNAGDGLLVVAATNRPCNIDIPPTVTVTLAVTLATTLAVNPSRSPATLVATLA